MYKLIDRIIELCGSFEEPRVEYYPHANADMWKWCYPLTQYVEHKIMLCDVNDEEASYIKALKMIMEYLETKEKDGTLIIDKVRIIRYKMDPTTKCFFDNLYITDITIALWAYKHLTCGKYTITEVFNMTCSKLIERNITVDMKKQNTTLNKLRW